jgi:hypothetical protein
MISDRYRFRVGDEVIEADLVITTAAEWEASEYARSPDWSVLRDGESGEVRALRLTIPTSLLHPRVERGADTR